MEHFRRCNDMPEIGHILKIGDIKYKLICSRSTKERAEETKKRLTRIGTISVKIRKSRYTHVGARQTYYLYARPELTLTWDRLDHAVMILM